MVGQISESIMVRSLLVSKTFQFEMVIQGEMVIPDEIYSWKFHEANNDLTILRFWGWNGHILVYSYVL